MMPRIILVLLLSLGVSANSELSTAGTNSKAGDEAGWQQQSCSAENATDKCAPPEDHHGHTKLNNSPSDGQSHPSVVEFLEWLGRSGLKGVAPSSSPPGANIVVKGSPKARPREKVLKQGENENEVEKGVFVTVPFNKGDTILKFPFSLALRSKVTEEEAGSQGRILSLMYVLLQERAKGKSSNFSTYIDSLPKRVHLPVFEFGKKDWEEFQYRPFIELLHTVHGVFNSSYQTFDKEEFAQATYEDFVWAANIVLSRPFVFPEFDEEGSHTGAGHMALVPLLDLLNHDHGNKKNVEWHYGPGECHMVASSDIESGDELFHPYTTEEKASNDFLMAAYGFFMEKNPKDYIVLWKSAEEALEWHLEKYGQCSKRGGAVWGAKPETVDNTKLRETFKELLKQIPPKESGSTGEMIVAVTGLGDTHPLGQKILAALWKARDLTNCLVNPREPTIDPRVKRDWMRVSSLENKNKLPDLVLLTVELRAAEMLAEFPTTIREDEAALEEARRWVEDRSRLCVDGRFESPEAGKESAPCPSKKRRPRAVRLWPAVEFRLEKKRILERVIERVEARYYVKGQPAFGEDMFSEK